MIMPIPDSVSREDFLTAIKPLMDLLGTNDRNFYRSPGMVIADGTISFTVPASHESAPDGRAVGVVATKVLPDHPHPQPSRVDGAELAYLVRVEIEGLVDL